MFDDEILSYIDHNRQSIRDSNSLNNQNKKSNPYNHMNNIVNGDAHDKKRNYQNNSSQFMGVNF